MDDLDIRERFTDREWAIYTAGECSYQVSYGVVTPTSEVGNVGYCREPSWPGNDLGYCRDHAFPDMADSIELITGTCPYQAFYATVNYGEGDYPQAVLVHEDSTNIVRVNYDGSYESAWLSAEPLENIVGFTPGWEC